MEQNKMSTLISQGGKSHGKHLSNLLLSALPGHTIYVPNEDRKRVLEEKAKALGVNPKIEVINDIRDKS